MTTVDPAGPEPGRNTTDPARKPRRGSGVTAVLALVIAVVAGAAGGLIVHLTSTKPAPVAVTECDAVAIADAVLPSVVTVHVGGAGGTSNGTGEVVRDQGYILTNDHVIASGVDGGTFSVLFSDGRTAPATLVGRVTVLDLAVIKVDGQPPLPVIAVAPDPVPVGQPVVALGSPLGLDGSVTRGIVSALGRPVRVPADGGGTAIIPGAIQTDATINPGNSGGPLVDCQGRMVGVNTAGASLGEGTTGSIGIGFAIPVDQAIPVADQLIATGRFAVPTFGLSVAPITAAVAGTLGAPPGLYVRSTVPGGPAATAGIAAGDVITQVAGQPAVNDDALTHVAVQSAVGDPVDIAYVRAGQTAHTTVVLGG